MRTRTRSDHLGLGDHKVERPVVVGHSWGTNAALALALADPAAVRGLVLVSGYYEPTLRADALLSDDFQPSDMAWLDMKSNTIDVVIGPIENYEDHLFGYKTSNEAFVLVKDKDWSARLAPDAHWSGWDGLGAPIAITT